MKYISTESFFFPEFLAFAKVVNDGFTSHGLVFPIYGNTSRVTFAVAVGTDTEHVVVDIFAAVFSRDDPMGVKQVGIGFATEKALFMGEFVNFLP